MEMTVQELINEAGNISFKNRSDLQDINSCYFCRSYVKKEDIEEFTDSNQTAICPVCGIDSIIPFEVDKETLKLMKHEWFEK
jgi:hypothetical protein